MKRLYHALVCTLVLLTSSTAWADECTGTVQSVTVAPEGDFFVNFGYNRVRICQLDGSVNVDRGSSNGGVASISAGRCAALLSSFLTARASGKPITARVGSSSCAFVDGAYPNPYPFQFVF